MFTGLIQAVGHIADRQTVDGGARLRIATGKLPLHDVSLGDSISTNGACLTAVALPGDGFWADVSSETLHCTTLGMLAIGARVNLEKALLPTDRLGGHLVSGHVDGLGEVLWQRPDGRSTRWAFRAPRALARYIAAKGSICIDGTSLTVNTVSDTDFEVNIIPQTEAETVFGDYRPGMRVNLEVDLIARYLERLLQAGAVPREGSGLSLETLAQAGYLSGQAER
jgi:riboflavin synthase